MGLIEFVLFLAVLAIVYWAVTALFTLPPPIVVVLQVIIGVLVLFAVLSLFGVVKSPFPKLNLTM